MVNGVHGCENIGVVAILADVRSRDMHRVLVCCIGAVMAARAIADDIHVVEIRRQPASACMTVVAIIAAIQVGWVLA